MKKTENPIDPQKTQNHQSKNDIPQLFYIPPALALLGILAAFTLPLEQGDFYAVLLMSIFLLGISSYGIISTTRKPTSETLPNPSPEIPDSEKSIPLEELHRMIKR